MTGCLSDRRGDREGDLPRGQENRFVLTVLGVPRCDTYQAPVSPSERRPVDSSRLCDPEAEMNRAMRRIKALITSTRQIRRPLSRRRSGPGLSAIHGDDNA
jgi:hypothetical protein